MDIVSYCRTVASIVHLLARGCNSEALELTSVGSTANRKLKNSKDERWPSIGLCHTTADQEMMENGNKFDSPPPRGRGGFFQWGLWSHGLVSSLSCSVACFLRHKTLSVGVTCEVRTALHNSTPIIMPPRHGTARHQNSSLLVLAELPRIDGQRTWVGIQAPPYPGLSYQENPCFIRRNSSSLF